MAKAAENLTALADAEVSAELARLAAEDRSGKWQAAASEDRFLQNIGRLQRFGTQYRRQADVSYSPGEADPAGKDCLRRALGVPMK